MNKKRKGFILIALAISMTFITNGCSQKAPEGVVAVVNKQDIPRTEFDESYLIQANVIKIRLGQEVLDQKGPDGIAVKDSLKEEVLIRMILEEIIKQDATKKEITITDAEVDDRIEAMKESMGGEVELEEYKSDLEMSDSYLRDFIKTDLLLSKHKDVFIKDVKLKEKDIKKFFQDNKEKLTLVKARQILVETEEEGREILEKLKAGEDFKKLAIENSKDLDSVVNGGELGFFQRGKYPNEFDEIVFGLKKGEISPLIKTEKGFHIVEVQEIKETYEDLKTEITNLTKANEYNDFLKKLHDEAKVKSYLEEAEKEK